MLHDRYRAERIFSRWRVRPSYGEEIRSYFPRLVADNADCTATFYALNCGLNPNDRQNMLEAVLRLPLTDEEKESLVRWTPTGYRNLSFCGHPVATERLTGLRRFCGECIMEGSYSRVWWSFSRFETCPFHDTSITEEKVTNHKVRFPYFGYHPGGIKAPPQITKRGAASFEAYILQRLGAVEPGVQRPMLDQYPLDAILCMVPAIGRLLRNPRSRETPPLRVGDAKVGFEALGHDDDHFEGRLSEWISTNVDLKAFRAASQAYYGHAALLWNEKNGYPDLQRKLVALMNRACGRYGSLGRALRNKSLVGMPPNGRDVQRELGLTRHGVDVLGQRAKLDVTRSEDGVLGYTPQIIESLRNEIKSLVPLPEVASALGCTVQDANRVCVCMAKRGWRGAVGVRVGKEVVRHVFRADLDAFLNILESLPERPADVDMVSFERYVRQTRGASVTGTMVAVLNGQLPAFKSRSSGLRALLFPHPLKRRYRGKPAVIGRRDFPKDTMQIAEFVAITGIRSTGIKFLVSQKHLLLHEPGVPLLNRSSAVAFHKRYVNLARYSVLGTISVERTSTLRKLGLTPAFDYRDIEALVVERPALAAKIGPLREYSAEERARWEQLRRYGERNCPSFTIPSIMGDGDMIIYTSSRKLFFRVLSFPDKLVINIKLHPRESRRAWRIYRENEEAIRRLLVSFRWAEDGESIVMQTAVKDSTDIDCVTREIGELTSFFRYRMP